MRLTGLRYGTSRTAAALVAASMLVLLSACDPGPTESEATPAVTGTPDPGSEEPEVEPTDPTIAADQRDVVYKTIGGAALKLDLYLGAGAVPHPLIVWVHGGGWRSGDKAQCLPTRLGFSTRGYTIACVNYRLSGVAAFPSQIEDVRDAVAFLRTNAGRFGLDPRRFAAWGSSAGGHLVALAGTTSGSAVFTADASASAVQVVIDFYGPVDLTAMATTAGYTTHARPDSAESLLLGGPVLDNPEKARQANPVTYVGAGDPPFLIVHGTADPVVPVDQSRLLYDALRAAAVTADLGLIAGAKHGGAEFSSPATTELVLRFLDEHFSP